MIDTPPNPVLPASAQPAVEVIAPEQAKFPIWKDVPGVYSAISIGKGQRGDAYYLDANTTVLGNALENTFRIIATAGDSTPHTVWADAESVVKSYGLTATRDNARSILAQMFGPTAELALEVASDPTSLSPSLVFRLCVPRSMREKRQAFVGRYAHEITLPERAPAPVLMWTYQDDVSA